MDGHVYVLVYADNSWAQHVWRYQIVSSSGFTRDRHIEVLRLLFHITSIWTLRSQDCVVWRTLLSDMMSQVCDKRVHAGYDAITHSHNVNLQDCLCNFLACNCSSLVFVTILYVQHYSNSVCLFASKCVAARVFVYCSRRNPLRLGGIFKILKFLIGNFVSFSRFVWDNVAKCMLAMENPRNSNSVTRLQHRVLMFVCLLAYELQALVCELLAWLKVLSQARRRYAGFP